MAARRDQHTQRLSLSLRRPLWRVLGALLVVALLALQLPAAPAHAFGADPHSYGAILVYDNITTNPAPGDFFAGGYAGYPHQPQGIELPIGMYRVKATWNGTNLQAAIYQRTETAATCSDNNAGILLGPNDNNLNAGHLAVNPKEGQDSNSTGFLCTRLYLNWRDGQDIRIQIWRVYAPEQQLSATRLRANVPVDSAASSAFYYQWYLSPTATNVITVSLREDWGYVRRGGYDELLSDPHNPSETIDPADCLDVFNGAGFLARVCVGEIKSWSDPRLSQAPIQITTLAHGGPVIFHVEADTGLPPDTPTPTPTPDCGGGGAGNGVQELPQAEPPPPGQQPTPGPCPPTPTPTLLPCGPGSGAGNGVQELPPPPPGQQPTPTSTPPPCNSPTSTATPDCGGTGAIGPTATPQPACATPTPTATPRPPMCPISSFSRVIIPQVDYRTENPC